MSAAHACNGYVTTVNQRGTEIRAKDFWTKKDGGAWVVNFSGAPSVAPHSSLRTKLVTTRKKSTAFRVKATLTDGDYFTPNAAKCSEGWTITVW